MIIYKIVNDVNNKVYIGQTTRSLSARKSQHLRSIYRLDSHLYRAMRKYGVEHFKFETICEASNIDDLNRLETYYIKKYNSVNNGYNMGYGGNNNVMFVSKTKVKHDNIMRSNIVRTKISNSMKKYRNENPFTEEHRNKLSKAAMGNHNFGSGDTRSVECYCIDENGIKHEFHNYKIAGKWWHDKYNPFNCEYNYATYRRKIIDSINTGKCEYGRDKYKIIVTSPKWFNK